MGHGRRRLLRRLRARAGALTAPPRRRRTWWAALAGVFAVALWLRLLYLHGSLPVLKRRQTPIYGDAAGYFLSAAALLHGRVDPASLDALPPLPEPSFDAGRARQLVSTRGPGYVAFFFRVFGVDPWPVRIAQALLGACVGSEPRWRAWRVDLVATREVAVQTLELPPPLAADEIRSALWLVDLETRLDPPPLRVGLDGLWLEPGAYAWQRLFCHPEAPRPPGAAPDARRPQRPLPFSDAELSEIWCRVYQEGIDRFSGALAGSPQWWGLRVDPARVAGRRSLSLRLAADGAAREPIRLGGSYARREPAGFVGPSLAGLTPGPGTSLTRWHVVHDWRFCETTPLASMASAGRFAGPASVPALAAAMGRGEAQLGIRLLLERADGRWEIYQGVST